MRVIKPIAVAGLLLVTGLACWVMCTPVVPTTAISSASNVQGEEAADPAAAAPALNASAPTDRAEPSPSAFPQVVRTGNLSEPLPPQKAAVEVQSALLTPVARGNPTPGSLAVAQANSIDPRSLALLSTLERDLHRAPPPAVHALVREHAQGASRERLLSLVEQTLAQELSVKLHVRRWIDQVAPEPNQPPVARKPLLSKGAGTGWVAPLTTR